MPIGIFTCVSAVALGGLVGSFIGPKLPEELKQKMNWIFGICSMGMGIASVVLMKNMPAVVFSVITGTLFGMLVHFGRGIEAGISRVMSLCMKNADVQKRNLMLTAVVLFCASGMGLYGSLDSGFSGNHSILIAKSVLDFYTAIIFACTLGKAMSLVAIPQFAVMITLFLTAKLILPLTTPDMIQDFKACGGFLLIAMSFRLMQLRDFPVADMIPAMVLVMPVSYIWQTWLLPLIG